MKKVKEALLCMINYENHYHNIINALIHYTLYTHTYTIHVYKHTLYMDLECIRHGC